MKTLCVGIAMIILFLLIPPDNKIDPKCYKETTIYQEKITYLLSDISCILTNIGVNIQTRKDNFSRNSGVFTDLLKNIENTNNLDRQPSSIHSLDDNLLKELGIDKELLNEESSLEEYQKLFNELSY